jgi:hypothetical protein
MMLDTNMLTGEELKCDVILPNSQGINKKRKFEEFKDASLGA